MPLRDLKNSNNILKSSLSVIGSQCNGADVFILLRFCILNKSESLDFLGSPANSELQ